MKRTLPLSSREACEAEYHLYLEQLKALISRRSVTTDEAALRSIIDHCRTHFDAVLTPLGWSVALDASGNLQCIPPNLTFDRTVLWLNAHADTVDASASDFCGRDPFTCVETVTHLIGRGSNDCKAGLAFMMWYAERMAHGVFPAFNGGFLVTMREEAGSTLPRTAFTFAEYMSSGTLPISTQPGGTFVWCLENTVSLASHLKADVPEIAVYDRERHSLNLLCRGSLHALGLALLRLDEHQEWKTVAIWPSSVAAARVEADEILPQLSLEPSALRVWAHDGGHSCVSLRETRTLAFT